MVRATPPVSGLPRLGLGGAALGGLYTHVDDDEAVAVVVEAVRRGLSYIDTAPLYGHGTSELRIGRALSKIPRAEVTISTKVGRLIEAASPEHSEHDMFADAPPTRVVRDYSRSGVLRSIESSLRRLGTDRVDIVYVHDPEDHMDDAISEAVPALAELREQGVVGAIGVGTNLVDVPRRFLAECDIDVVLLAGRWTLLDRTGESLLDSCGDRGVAVVLGGIMNSGLLADPDNNPTFDYLPAADRLVVAAKAMRQECTRAGVSLGAAAVQHAFRHPSVRTVLVGCRNRLEVDFAAGAAGADVDADLWQLLDILAEPLQCAEPAS